MILDTDVLIWFLRGNQRAMDYIIEENETLVTANDKHYKVVEGLQMTVFRP